MARVTDLLGQYKTAFPGFMQDDPNPQVCIAAGQAISAKKPMAYFQRVPPQTYSCGGKTWAQPFLQPQAVEMASENGLQLDAVHSTNEISSESAPPDSSEIMLSEEELHEFLCSGHLPSPPDDSNVVGEVVVKDHKPKPSTSHIYELNNSSFPVPGPMGKGYSRDKVLYQLINPEHNASHNFVPPYHHFGHISGNPYTLPGNPRNASVSNRPYEIIYDRLDPRYKLSHRTKMSARNSGQIFSSVASPAISNVVHSRSQPVYSPVRRAANQFVMSSDAKSYPTKFARLENAEASQNIWPMQEKTIVKLDGTKAVIRIPDTQNFLAKTSECCNVISAAQTPASVPPSPLPIPPSIPPPNPAPIPVLPKTPPIPPPIPVLPRTPPPPAWWEKENETLMRHVFAYVSQRDAVKCMLVCKKWANWIRSEECIWLDMDLGGNTQLDQHVMRMMAIRNPLNINLSWTGISREELEAFLSSATRVRNISLAGCHWSSVEALIYAPSSLRQLDLRWVPGCTDANFKGIVSKCDALRLVEDIFLSGCDISDTTVRLIANQFPKLKCLDLSYCAKLTNLSVEVLCGAGCSVRRHLSQLTLSGCHNMTSSIFGSVHKMLSLHTLDVRAIPNIIPEACDQFDRHMNTLGRNVIVLR